MAYTESFLFLVSYRLFAGCCFVTFYTRKDALKAQDALHNIKTLMGVSKQFFCCTNEFYEIFAETFLCKSVTRGIINNFKSILRNEN
jgi:hypothetical protein